MMKEKREIVNLNSSYLSVIALEESKLCGFYYSE